jgi:hypothetical protein
MEFATVSCCVLIVQCSRAFVRKTSWMCRLAPTNDPSPPEPIGFSALSTIPAAPT